MDAPALRTEGLLLVNKPTGPTSYDMIRWVKRSVRGTKIGHCGTLDPLASGLMILLLGKATKQQSVYMGHEKVYCCVMRCGLRTASGDILGDVIEQRDVPASNMAAVRAVLDEFLGEQQQLPPMFSAIKRDGVPLYKLARQGKTVERLPRTIHIHGIDLLALRWPDISLRVRCSAGTYVRTLVEDVARRLGTCGTLLSLERESIGAYAAVDAVPGDDLKSFSADDIRSRLRAI